MSFNEKILLPATDKFYMVRLQGGKLFSSGNTTGLGTVVHGISGFTMTVYESTIQTGLSIKDFYLNDNDPTGSDVVITRIGSDTFPNSLGVAPSYNTYYYNPETGYFKFCIYSATPISSITNSAILEYYLFYTSYTGKRAPIDMVNGEAVYWSPRLPKDITLGFSQSNNLSGQLSVSTSGISLKNQDLYFNDFFGANDSFNNREVKVWRCLDTVDNYQFEFSGIIKGAKIDDDEVSFEVNDILSVLEDTFYGHDPLFSRYEHFNGVSSYSVKGEDQDAPIYRIFGKTGPYDIYYKDTAQILQTRMLDSNKTLPAICVSYNASSKTTSTNRTWSCGIGPTVATTKTKTVSSVSDITSGTYKSSTLFLSTDPSEIFIVGDTFKLGSYYGIVSAVMSGNVIESWPYNASFAAGTIERVKVPAVVIVIDGVKYHPLSFRDYTCQIGANGDVQIVFVNNFEANHPGMGTLDPDTCEIFARVWYDEFDSKSSSIVETVLIEAGLTTATTFMPDQTPAWIDVGLAFSIPFTGSNDYPSCREVVEKCLKSALSFIYFDNAGELRYKSFLDGIQADPNDIENQSSQDHTDGISQSNSSKFSVAFDFYDQFIGTNFLFSHAPQSTNFYFSQKDSYKVFPENLIIKWKRLYRTNKYYEVDCLIDTNFVYYDDGLIYNSFLESYNGLVTGRRAECSLSVFSRHFKMYVGDDILLSRTKVIGGENSSYMRVISISKSSNESALRLLDLKRFPQ